VKLDKAIDYRLIRNIEAWAMSRGYDPEKAYARGPSHPRQVFRWAKLSAEDLQQIRDAGPGDVRVLDESERRQMGGMLAGLQPPPGYLSPHFTQWEFQCKHCGQMCPAGIAKALVDVLEDVRSAFGDQPVHINSGYRCPTHNAEVGGVEDSQHLEGTAADFTVEGTSPEAVYGYLDPWHTGGLGSYETFVHVDVRDSYARWTG
jgi:hypothetical protein